MKKLVLLFGILSLELILINVVFSQGASIIITKNNVVVSGGSGCDWYTYECWVNENAFLGFTWTTYWDPPAPEKPICLWATELPPGASFPTKTAHGSVSSDFSWTPTYCQAGTYTVNFHGGETCGSPLATWPVEITVHNINRNPTITINPQGSVNVKTGQKIHVDISAEDLDYSECHDNTMTLNYKITPAPSLTPTFIDYGNGNGVFDWITAPADEGSHAIDFNVTDNLNGFDVERLTANIALNYGNILYYTSGNEINFTYNASCNEKCKKIVFIQVMCEKVECVGGGIKDVKPGDGNLAWKYRDKDTVDGGKLCYVDYIDGEKDLYYNGDDPADIGKQGNHTAGNIKNATMSDRPFSGDSDIVKLDDICKPDKAKKDIYEFETCVYCNSSSDSGKYYGCILWNYTRSKGDPNSGISTATGTADAPSVKFLDAVTKWLSNPR
jgi:hypothetical protein